MDWLPDWLQLDKHLPGLDTAIEQGHLNSGCGLQRIRKVHW